ncbi:nucleotidyltransferase family protein [Dictyobacter arantiisoli]|uniref:Molybdenum cofactor cytidylyltransferase n=1 Tax=Dictyobacter arantiisoli TaxID=2014874 RepID=A0A5A5TFA5_9CHLR|nr:nucleotidyltransferase family protein [Dictyobacter arantiisoli]GCF10102.1 molybdenum cofactor cytidylyltransferase [Dictyobacter arantiisoli]
MPEVQTTAAIILAAGKSSRMNHEQHKLLLPLGGRPILAHTLDAVQCSQATPILLVLGHQAEQIENAIRDSLQKETMLLHNPTYQQGMSTSLCLALQILIPRPTIDSAIILLGDQPFMSPALIDELIKTRHKTGQSIIAASYHGKRGNPVLFGRELWEELGMISGDEGGKSVIARHKQELVTIETDEIMINHDVDTWDAYQQALTYWQSQQQIS